jgi:hypothetical protein
MSIDLSSSPLIRWPDADPSHVALMKQAGVTAVVLDAPNEAFSQACSAASIGVLPASHFRFVKVTDLEGSGSNTVLTDGNWPGVTRPPTVDGRGDETASASREPWVDANGYWVGYLRALYPQRPALLGHVPDLGDRSVPFDTLELALIEAWVAGGNYILAVEPHYRQALLRQDSKALAAWSQLGRTAKWLQEHIALFRQPSLPIITALVEPGAQTAEIANLLYRRNASPLLWNASAPPPPDDPGSRLALVAANLKPPAPAVTQQILAHARAGASLVVAGRQPWWKAPDLQPVRSEEDRDFFGLGKGQVIAYHRPVVDPSEFALDVIDVVTHKQRAVRLWNAPAVIALATASPRTGERLVHLVNYGKPVDTELQARVQGHFTSATLMRPEGEPIPLKPAKRGSTTEVFVPELQRLSVLVFR